MEKSLTNSQVNKYGFYLFTSSLAVMVQMTYMTIYMTDIIGISASVVATALLVARILDFLVGVISGGIIEKTRMPWGKYRSWLLVLRWAVIFSLVCCFLDTSTWPMGFRIGISFLGYILMNMSMSFTSNAFYGLGPALAGANLNDRFRLSARSQQFLVAAMLVTSALTIPLVNLFTPYVGAGNSYLVVSLLFGIPYIFGCQMVSNLCKECDPSGKAGEGGTPKSTVTLGDMVKSVVQNKQMLVVFMAYTIYYVGLYIISNLASYYYKYIAGDLLFMTYASTAVMIVGLIASVVMPMIGGKIGKKKSLIVALVIYGVMCIFYRFAGANWIMYAVLGAIGGASVYLFTTFGANYFIDCGEYYLHETGKDTRDIAISMYSVPMKIGMTLGGAIAIYALDFIGFHANMTIDAAFQSSFMTLLSTAPAIMMFLGAIIMAVGYKITDKDAQRYAEENAKKYAPQFDVEAPETPEGVPVEA